MGILDKLTQYKTALETLGEEDKLAQAELEKKLAEAKGNTTGDYIKAGLSKLGDAFGYALDPRNPVTTSFWGQLKDAETSRVAPIQKELDAYRKRQKSPLEQLGAISNIEYKDALINKASKEEDKEAKKEQARIDRENRQYYKRVKSAYLREKGKAADDIKSVLDKLSANEKRIDEVADGSLLGRLNYWSDSRIINKENLAKHPEVKENLREAAIKMLQSKGALKGRLSNEAITNIVNEYVEARSQGKRVKVEDLADKYIQETRGDLVDELASLSEYSPTASKKVPAKKKYVWNAQTGKMEAK